MPVLSSEYLASWYVLQSGSSTYLFKSWDDVTEQSAQPEALLQGDIGVRNMNIGGAVYTSSVVSPVVIAEQNIIAANSTVISAFGLLSDSFAVIQNPLTNLNPPNYLMQSGSVDIKPESVDVSLSFVCDAIGAFDPVYNPTPLDDTIYRTANFLDTQITFNVASGSYSYFIRGASLKFNVKIDRVYLPGQGVLPFFAVQGYTVSGSVEILIKPSDFDAVRGILLPFQQQGQLITTNRTTSSATPDLILISVGNNTNSDQLRLGKAMVVQKLRRGFAPGGLCTATMDFEAYVNSTSGLTRTVL
jgi:hypothetical protein